MAPREPLERVLSDAELRENERDEGVRKHDAKLVALMALPGETSWVPFVHGAACSFLYYSR